MAHRQRLVGRKQPPAALVEELGRLPIPGSDIAKADPRARLAHPKLNRLVYLASKPKVIAATASEAPHVLDGLLQHQTGLRIAEMP
jgi:hypothetical protein